jgi:4-oxalomesaconate hydratase
MGDKVRVLALSNGERSESGGLYKSEPYPTLDEVRAIRHEEAEAAAAIIGVEMRYLNWDDLRFDYSAENARIIAEEMRAFRADVVLTHHGPDCHSVDHDTAWHLATRAAQLASAIGMESAYKHIPRPEVFMFEATIPLTELEGFNPDFYVDITDTMETKIQALKTLARAQAFLEPWYIGVAEQRAFQASRLAGNNAIKYAEAFERTQPWVGAALPTSR